MRESPWHRRATPMLVAIGVAAALTSGPAGAADPPWVPPACGGHPTIASSRPSDGGPSATTWYRLDPELDETGTTTRVALSLGRYGVAGTRTLHLPPESFAAGPYGDVVLAGSDDGRTSRLIAIDVVRECAWTIATEADVIRRAVVDPTGLLVHEMRVDRRTRADRGVWARSLDGTGSPTRVLPPIAADGRFGRTFSTELSWSAEGDRLVVQSCGASACRTRVLDPSSGRVRMVDDPDLGEAIGLAGERLVSYEACRGLPCPLVSVDMRSGRRTVLAEDAGTAVVVVTERGPRVVHEVGAGTRPALRTVGVDGVGHGHPRSLPRGVRLVAGPARTGGSAALAPDLVLLAGDGRAPRDRAAAAFVHHVETAETTALQEVTR
jgi:hypothetical protein